MRFIIITRKRLINLSLLAAACVLVLALSVKAITLAVASGDKKKLPVYCTEQQKKVIALSFDAAWGNEDTQILIDTLHQYNAKATFFLVGDWVENYPDSTKQLFDAGFEIGNHSNKHPHIPNLSAGDIGKEIDLCNQKIEAVTGIRPRVFRAPYGEYSNSLIDVLADRSMLCIQWDVDSHDWMDKSADYIVERVTSKVKPGSICLFHNAAKNTPEALPRILETLTAQGYEFVTVSDLILWENYKILHDGKQVPN